VQKYISDIKYNGLDKKATNLINSLVQDCFLPCDSCPKVSRVKACKALVRSVPVPFNDEEDESNFFVVGRAAMARVACVSPRDKSFVT